MVVSKFGDNLLIGRHFFGLVSEKFVQLFVCIEEMETVTRYGDCLQFQELSLAVNLSDHKTVHLRRFTG